MRVRLLRSVLLIAILGCWSCSRSSAPLSQALEQRFQGEGVTRRGDDLLMRYSHDLGTNRSGWEERPLSIVVTHQTIFIHDRDQVLLEVTPRSTGDYRVSRERDRISLHAGARRSFAFHPAEDAEGWAKDLRAVIAETAREKRR